MRTSYARAIKLTLLAAWLAVANLLQAQTSEAWFEKGTQAYSEGRFQEAVESYQHVIQSHDMTPNLCYNLANAYAQLGQIGPAVLYGERALAQGSFLTSASENLKKIRQVSGLNNPTSAWQHFFLWMNVGVWAACFAFLLVYAALCFMLKSFHFQRFDRLGKINFIVTASIAAFFFAGLWITWPIVGRVVVIESNARLQISPFESAEAMASLKEGEVVQLTGLGYSPHQHHDFWEVQTQDGRRGWVQKKYVERVVPLE